MITKRQKQTLDFIKYYINKKGYAPSLEEIKDHLKLSSVSTAHHHVKSLEKLGLLKKEENQPRAIDVYKKEALISIPLLGTIAAGEPIEAIQEKEIIVIPKAKLSQHGDFYALRVSGNSMIDENINDGDVVIVKNQPTAENSQKVIALLNDSEVTLKKIYFEDNKVRLQPANAQMRPILVNPNNILIQGIVVDIIKNTSQSNGTLNPSNDPPPEDNDKEYIKENQIICGDARTTIPRIRPNSIACSVWSPPYHVGKEYEKGMTFEEWKDLLKDVISLHFDIMKPGGFLVINIADILCFQDPNMPKIQALTTNRQKYSIEKDAILAFIKKHPNYNREQIAKAFGCSEQTIDRRLNGNNIRGGKSNTQTRVKVVGGLIENMGTMAGFYLYDRRIWVKDPAWANNKWHSLSYRSVDEFEYLYIFWKPGITKVDRKRINAEEWKRWGSRAVWHFPSVRANNDHEAKFPLELPKRVIKLFSDPGEVILDCFIGSGTTALAAIEEKRNFIGIDIQPKYVKLAKQAIETLKSTPRLF